MTQSLQPSDPHTVRPLLPIQHAAPNPVVQQPPVLCCGRLWTWIVDYICTPIYRLFSMIFCCSKNQPVPISSHVLTTIGAGNAAAESAPRLTAARNMLRQPVCLDPPTQISPPLQNFDPSIWPAGNRPAIALQQLLQFLACSNESAALFTILAQPEPDQSENLTNAAPSTARPLHQLLQNHLSAVVEKIRNPNPEAPLTNEHLQDLRTFFSRNALLTPTTINGFDLWCKLCEKLQCETLIDDFDPMASLLTQIILNGPFLPRPVEMGTITIPNETQLPVIPSMAVGSQKNLNHLLMLLANSLEIDAWGSTELNLEAVYQENDTDSQIRQKHFKAKVESAKLQLLRNHLTAITNKLRSDQQSEMPTASELKTLLDLIAACGGNTRGPIKDLLKFLCLKFKGTPEQFRNLYERYLSDPNSGTGKVLSELPAPLAASRRAEEMTIPLLNSNWPREQQILYHLLAFIAQSPHWDQALTNDLSSTLVPRREQETESQFTDRLFANHADNAEKIVFQRHLSHIIHSMRTQTSDLPEEDIHPTAKEIQILQSHISLSGGNCRGATKDLLKFLCLKLKMTPEDFSAVYTAYISDPDFRGTCDLLESAEELAPSHPVVKMALLPLELELSEEQKALSEALGLIAAMSSWDRALTQESSATPAPKSERETDSQYATRIFEFHAGIAEKSILQKHVRALIHSIRTQDARPIGVSDSTAMSASRIEPKHLNKLKQLLQAQGCLSRNSTEIIQCLANRLNVSKDTVWKTITPVLWNEIKDRTLNDPGELPAALDTTISRPLPNLGATCYLNSVLQTIASLSCFDEALTHELCMTPPVRQEGESLESFEARSQSAQERFLTALPYRIALQNHLRSLIRMMRLRETNHPIPANILETLFHLLQVNGWYFSPGSQQDPQELLAWLREKLDSNVAPIHTITTHSYVQDGVTRSFQKHALDSELILDIPLSTGRRLDPAFNTVNKLIDYSFNRSGTDDEKVAPPGQTEQFATAKHTCIVGEPPQTLFIQQKRFGFTPDPLHPNGGTSFRIEGSTPFSPTITIPVYPENLQGEPVVHTYKLRVVIAHHGASTNSGHYTAWALQKYLDEDQQWTDHKDSWFIYDDAHDVQRYPPSDPDHPQRMINEIRNKGYYLTYVLVPPEEEA